MGHEIIFGEENIYRFSKNLDYELTIEGIFTVGQELYFETEEDIYYYNKIDTNFYNEENKILLLSEYDRNVIKTILEDFYAKEKK